MLQTVMGLCFVIILVVGVGALLVGLWKLSGAEEAYYDRKRLKTVLQDKYRKEDIKCPHCIVPIGFNTYATRSVWDRDKHRWEYCTEQRHPDVTYHNYAVYNLDTGKMMCAECATKQGLIIMPDKHRLALGINHPGVDIVVCSKDYVPGNTLGYKLSVYRNQGNHGYFESRTCESFSELIATYGYGESKRGVVEFGNDEEGAVDFSDVRCVEYVSCRIKNIYGVKYVDIKDQLYMLGS